MTPIKAIRAYCISCNGQSKKEVRLCPATDCELYPYRMGHRPKQAGEAPAEDETDLEETEGK